MIALLQRVSQARVVVSGETVGEIGPGILALVGVTREDGAVQVARLLERMLGYRLFEDGQGRMNLSLRDTGGGLLLVPQFTLAADTRKGLRASFTPAADPAVGGVLFAQLAARAQEAWPRVATGRFGADMAVSLTNDGPVTFWIEAR
ncbi:D-aminoacyl-tRNA deacylase [Ectothiorhodospira lacustris]|uniref:D-aminoacyl-tRNA deacylase n=1 Tax=Ectothiorhodospira lacustris TaxID=2899127 RepID=UPI001EE81703|nr:D-aminoacyl-tRNA deacylase [Ectothiorhodospira lacustris]MCG5500718.1 D-tyrosyl-tRNA(Tyr) deacylase [Ectothiorhodospira lacustris]MCG5509063.1 D-tyrosyl-tRNA(Tyr) deacylase [Ectothiorhodospira lacustris]MCG5520854.1 D-tyrosyl-tRNA(Tyr) deacylase [Ectothiorhodospira lacustris]